MKKNRYTEEQIAYVLMQAELGKVVPEICRRLRSVEQAFSVGEANTRERSLSDS